MMEKEKQCITTNWRIGVFILFPFFIGLLGPSCKSISTDDQIRATIDTTLSVINRKDYNKLQRLIENDSRGEENMEFIVYDINKIDYLIDKYYDGNVKKLSIIYEDGTDELSRKKIVIPIFSGFDSATGLKTAVLNLYVGPPQMIDLDKLSGFEYEDKYDAGWATKLIEEGKGINFDDPIREVK